MAAMSRVLSLNEAATLRPQQIVDLSCELAAARQQLDWFKRQLFGQKSERRLVADTSGQMSLGDMIDAGSAAAPAERTVAAHTRRPATKQPDAGDESVSFFDASRVPVETIELPAQTGDLAPEAYEIVSHKESYRLAQRPGSYVVLKYVRPVIKVRENGKLRCPPAPQGVLEGSRADVSFLAGLLIDKFAYHLPLYRQHQRLLDAGFTVSRPWLTQLVSQA